MRVGVGTALPFQKKDDRHKRTRSDNFGSFNFNLGIPPPDKHILRFPHGHPDKYVHIVAAAKFLEHAARDFFNTCRALAKP